MNLVPVPDSEMIGRRFGRLVVVSRIQGVSPKRFLCICDCGRTKEATGTNLRAGHNLSCLCLQREMTSRLGSSWRRHGESASTEYASWKSMMARCHGRHKHFYRYGGRGITVCERWHTFETFLADMGRKPDRTWSIDRIDNDGNYEPSNCRWADAITQNNNNGNVRLIEFNGESLSISQWERRVGAPVMQRLRKGWSIERALTEPRSVRHAHARCTNRRDQ